MTQINITDFRNNIKKYSDLAQNEELCIVNHGNVLFYVQGKKSRIADAIDALKGSCKSDENYEDILKTRLNEI